MSDPSADQETIERFLYEAMDLFLGEHHQETFPITLVQRLRYLNAHGELPSRGGMNSPNRPALPPWCRHA